ncbi:NAD-dependent epimerase/dehydratase family protein [Pontimonas sp.]|nr:NAD-dependent epimerase/dehydratase family protein [Pontimonas sp.]
MSHFFITGGAGFLGINLVRRFLALGHSVTTFDRSPFDYPESGRVTHVVGDIRDADALSKAMADADAVIHAAAALPLNSREEIFSVDVDGTRQVIEEARQLSIDRFVHISSTAVYGVPKVGGLTEDAPLVGVGAYGSAKIAAEKVVADYRDRMTVTIVRPKSFIGPERLGVFSILYDWASTGHHFPIPGKGANLYQYLDVEDLCGAIELALSAPRPIANETYNFGASDFGTFREDFQAVLDRAGFGKSVKSVPVLPAIFALRLLDKLGLSPLYPWVYETAVKDSYVSIDKARRNLNWSPTYSNQEALVRNYVWYVNNKSAFGAESGTTHRVPWKQGALGLAKHLFR